MSARGKANGEALAALELILGAPPPAGVAALGAAELSRLATAIEAARERHSEALSQALDQAFLQVPRLLRGGVKRIVGR